VQLHLWGKNAVAKKQEASAKKPKAAPRTKAKPAKAENAEAPAAAPVEAKKRAAKPKAAAPREITNETIGATAGQVWSALADNGGQSLAALKKAVGATDDQVLLALGWLAREDKLAFDANGRTITVSLR
jgi:hypothetical protein